MFCKLCNGNKCGPVLSDIEIDGTGSSVYYCQECLAGFTDPAPSEEIVKTYYSEGVYRTSTGSRFIRPLEIMLNFFIRRKAKKYLRSLKSGATVLDIGCGRGDLLIQMQKEGMKVVGTEIDTVLREYLEKNNGITVHQCPDAIGPASVDMITLHHVLEHVQNPNNMLRSVSNLLKNEGNLIVVVPNFASLQAKFGGTAWFHLDLPQHLYHFSEAGLKKLLSVHGFVVTETGHFDAVQNIFGWLQTLFNRIGIRRNLLYEILKNRSLKKPIIRKAGPFEFVATLLMLPLAVPVAVMLSLVEVSAHRGGTVELHMTKRRM